MRGFNPKMRLVQIDEPFKEDLKGQEIRENNALGIVYKAPISPLPLEYKDIDSAMHKFIENNIDIDFDGQKIPLFTVYSLQRFSEKQQTMEHSDGSGNVYLNFMNITRNNAPHSGTIHGSEKVNIPGDKDFTYLIRDVLSDNGTEHYEVYTMKQPFSVDLEYTLNFICTSFELLNTFNMKINKLFKSKQCYMKPNGHSVRITLEGISDSTNYNVEERRFFAQTVKFKVFAYIIQQEDFQVKKVPKTVLLGHEDLFNNPEKSKVEVCLTEQGESVEEGFKNVVLTVKFKPFESLVKFEIDDDIRFENYDMKNLATFRVFVNDTLYFHDNGFEVKKGDILKLKIISQQPEFESILTIGGKSKSKTYSKVLEETAENDLDNYSTEFIDIE